MKKIFLMGRSEAGKTSLTQALKGEELHYHKTQYTGCDSDHTDGISSVILAFMNTDM